MIRNFVYMRAATKTVVVMMHATIVKAWYGCKVYAPSKYAVTPGGGVKPGASGVVGCG